MLINTRESQICSTTYPCAESAAPVFLTPSTKCCKRKFSNLNFQTWQQLFLPEQTVFSIIHGLKEDSIFGLVLSVTGRDWQRLAGCSCCPVWYMVSDPPLWNTTTSQPLARNCWHYQNWHPPPYYSHDSSLCSCFHGDDTRRDRRRLASTKFCWLDISAVRVTPFNQQMPNARSECPYPMS